ncbi:MFS transporter [Rhizobium sp. P38BS-XIX]|uniref:MFS transporter n=1 Tax=Rhizobium sp. P38BS-XIX TaxID=2726740 RepID=UPI0014571752|nr:MFS transporter [Rhizobium sp. P38BS-XIX]NLS01377.1 MFS transporter [Rhizobium sp. P38BS-XIX]
MQHNGSSATASVDQEPPRAFVTLVAIATGALVANLYYAQPLVASIGAELGISDRMAGSITSITQIGYGAGLFLLVSLADIVENRRLVLTTLSLTIVALIAAAVSTVAVPFLIASFVVGVCSTGAQVLIPFVSHLVPPERRGRTVGNIMAGLLTGIMLARPASLFIAASLGWRAVFWGSAVLMVLILVALVRMMPKHAAKGRMKYSQILGSMAGLWLTIPALRWRAAFQFLMFAAFNMFWTAAPLMLAEQLGLSQRAIGFFALAGAGGALAAPLAGRLADRGHSKMVTLGSMLLVGVGFLATGWAAAISSVVGLAILAFLLDAGVQGNQVVSQRIIFSAAGQENRGRINALYMTVTFAGGALGSLLGTVTYQWGGWSTSALAGGLLGVLLIVLFALQQVSASRHPA